MASGRPHPVQIGSYQRTAGGLAGIVKIDYKGQTERTSRRSRSWLEHCVTDRTRPLLYALRHGSASVAEPTA